jgi:hypothetical protein
MARVPMITDGAGSPCSCRVVGRVRLVPASTQATTAWVAAKIQNASRQLRPLLMTPVTTSGPIIAPRP